LDEHDLAQPIAFGTDGVPVYFSTGGNDFYGSGRYSDVNNLPADVDLDVCNAAVQDDGTYIYYTTSEVPYVIGCHRTRVAEDIGMDVPPGPLFSRRAIQWAACRRTALYGKYRFNHRLGSLESSYLR
jgi:hypothetical protein